MIGKKVRRCKSKRIKNSERIKISRKQIEWNLSVSNPKNLVAQN